MKTSQRQISLFTEDLLIFSQADSPANLTHQQERDLGKRTSATSGRICSEQFRRLNQPTLWAKMFVDLLIGTGEWSSRKCVLTWKVVGTKYNRYYCQLVPSVRHTEEIEFGLLPTPTTQESAHYDVNLTETNRRKSNNGNSHSLNLTDQAIRGLLPTPTTFDSTNASATMKSTQVKEGSMHSMTLTRMLDKGMLPTPLKSDYNASWKTENWEGSDLSSVINEALGTRSQLNPRFVAEMMGFPTNWTELPFQSGGQNPSKDMEMQ